MTERPGFGRSILIGIGIVPSLYALGFLCWSTYFARMDLGFHDLAPQRYLIVGLVFAAFFLPMVFVELWFNQNGWQGLAFARAKTAVASAFGLTALRLALCYIAFVLMGMTLDAFGVIALTPLEAALWSLGVSGLVAGIGLALTLFLAAMMAILPRLSRFLDRLPFPQISIEVKAPRWTMKELHGRLMTTMGVLWWALVGASFFGHVMLEKVSPEYGGAAPQAATLAIDTTLLPPGFDNALFHEERGRGNVSWTKSVNVFFVDDESIVFRIADDANAIRYEISRDVVVAITWERGA